MAGGDGRQGATGTIVRPMNGMAEAATDPDRTNRLRSWLEELEAIERPSASDGELEAARWISEQLAGQGLDPKVEVESAHGTYWWPLGIGAGLGVAAGLASLARRPLLAGVLGAAGLAAIARDFPPHERPLRKALPERDTFNVVCELGNPDAPNTVVLVAHHDAANSGFVFHPSIPDLVSKTGLFRHLDTSPMLMAPVLGGPAMAILSALTGSRALGVGSVLLSAGSIGAMADVGLRGVVPGANDNGTAVVGLLDLAARFLVDPPESTRIVLLSTGSEESFSEGMLAFGRRHFGEMPKDRTFFINMDTIGSPHLTVLRGEGFLKMYEYPADALALADRTAEEIGIELFPNLRIRNGTDGLEALAAGYPVVSICSCTEHKQPANYHWPNDLAENVDFETVVEALDLAEAMVRRLDTDWDGALGRA